MRVLIYIYTYISLKLHNSYKIMCTMKLSSFKCDFLCLKCSSKCCSLKQHPKALKTSKPGPAYLVLACCVLYEESSQQTPHCTTSFLGTSVSSLLLHHCPDLTLETSKSCNMLEDTGLVSWFPTLQPLAPNLTLLMTTLNLIS